MEMLVISSCCRCIFEEWIWTLATNNNLTFSLLSALFFGRFFLPSFSSWLSRVGVVCPVVHLKNLHRLSNDLPLICCWYFCKLHKNRVSYDEIMKSINYLQHWDATIWETGVRVSHFFFLQCAEYDFSTRFNTLSKQKIEI